MIITIEEVKEYLRIDSDDEDALLSLMISVAETEIKNATAQEFDETNDLAKLYCLMTIQDSFENRELTGDKPRVISPRAQSILLQLKFCYGDEE